MKTTPAYDSKSTSLSFLPPRALNAYDENVRVGGHHENGAVKIYTGTLKDGFAGADSFCNLKGCYRLNVELDAQKGLVDKAAALALTATSFFSVCGHRGRIPFSAPLCIDPLYGVCYGVSGCPVLKSYAKRSSRLNAFMSYESAGKEIFVQNLPVRGIREMCTLKPLCYKVAVSGRNDSNGLFDLCDTTIQAPAIGTMCTGYNEHNNTICTSNTIKTVVCPDKTVGGAKVAHTSIFLFKYARGSTGWGDDVNYHIRAAKSSAGTPALYTGTLRDGSFGTDALCLPANQCFIFTIDEDQMDPFGMNYNLWVMCG